MFPQACLVGDRGVLRGRRFGNLVAGRLAVDPPVPELTRGCAATRCPARVVAGDELDRFAGGAAPVRDADATDSPAPPGLFTRPWRRVAGRWLDTSVMV